MEKGRCSTASGVFRKTSGSSGTKRCSISGSAGSGGQGYDLQDLGSRAYRIAAEVMDLLAEDRKLRDFFKQNRLLMLPLEEEAIFLRHCSARFPVYADMLRRLQSPARMARWKASCTGFR